MGKDKKNQTTHIGNLILVHATTAAFLVRTHDGEKIWIPKSQVYGMAFGKDLKDDESGLMVKEINDLEIPAWLAKDKGLM